MVQSKRVYSYILLLLVAVTLPACITTTTGGFAVEASKEQALQDYIQLAIAYYDADDMPGARRHLNNAMNISDRESGVYAVLALIFQREGDLDLAGESFRRAISLDRNNSRARNNYAAMLFGMEDYEEAFEQLERVANDTDYEGRAIAFENLGRAAVQLGRSNDAKNSFERALQLNSNLYVSALELATVKFEQADFSGARSNFQSYLTIVEFYNLPHTPRALLAGIQIEGHFQNQDFVDNFSLVLRTLYQSSPEYQLYLGLVNGR